MYGVAVKPHATKAVQIKCNSDLSSFQLHFITNFVLTELASSNLFTAEGVGCICAFGQGSLCCDVYVKGKISKKYYYNLVTVVWGF